jgi:hypothetical protein
LLSKGYERWHCDVERTTQPDLPTVAAARRALADTEHRIPSACRLAERSGQYVGRQHEAQRGPRLRQSASSPAQLSEIAEHFAAAEPAIRRALEILL